jgi:hypothetical protein
MRRKALFISFGLALVISSCGMMESVIKSTFPYTTTLMVPKSSPVGEAQSVMANATSFDQDFTKDGNNANSVSEVRVVSAKIQSRNPSDFNIGNFTSIHIFIAKADGSDEVMVASRTDITPGVGNSMVLDIDNSHFLDEMVRQPNVRIRMAYRLRNHINVNANLHLILGLGAYPRN